MFCLNQEGKGKNEGVRKGKRKIDGQEDQSGSCGQTCEEVTDADKGHNRQGCHHKVPLLKV